MLIATENYHRVGGTETYVHTIAEQLLRLGHQVRVYSTHLGDMAQLSRGVGVDVVSRPEDLEDPDDVVIAQDAATSYEMAGRWPGVPQLYVCHSILYDLQQPPLLRGTVQTVVVMNDRVGNRLRQLDGELDLVRLRQPIDSEWLAPRGEPGAKPRRALLLGNYLDGPSRELLVDTWTEQGVECVQVGSATRPTLQPQADIAAADIVVGKGRAVLDAMSCGRPVYVYDAYGADGWVTAETYDAIEADGFGGQALAEMVDAQRLREDLATYDPVMGAINRRLILQHHDAREHANRLSELCRDLAPQVARDVDAARELARQVRLRWRAESEVISLQTSLRQAQNELVSAHQDLAAVQHELEAVRGDLEITKGQRDKARSRSRKLARRAERLRGQRWMRLGAALRLVRPR